jgi:hypothetical protein
MLWPSCLLLISPKRYFCDYKFTILFSCVVALLFLPLLSGKEDSYKTTGHIMVKESLPTEQAHRGRSNNCKDIWKESYTLLHILLLFWHTTSGRTNIFNFQSSMHAFSSIISSRIFLKFFWDSACIFNTILHTLQVYKINSLNLVFKVISDLLLWPVFVKQFRSMPALIEKEYCWHYRNNIAGQNFMFFLKQNLESCYTCKMNVH